MEDLLDMFSLLMVCAALVALTFGFFSNEKRISNLEKHHTILVEHINDYNANPHACVSVCTEMLEEMGC